MEAFPAAAAENFDRRWHEFVVAAEAAGVPVPTAAEILPAIRAGFAFSEFVARSCIRRPVLLDDLIGSGDLQRTYGKGDWGGNLEAALEGVLTDGELAAGLRRHRCREMVRIACRDLAGWTDLDETLSDLSNLADACIVQTLGQLYRWQCDRYGTPLDADGRPQKLVVLGMGKLGAWELNFSSDIDLVFAYPEPGQTTAGHPVGDFFHTPVAQIYQSPE